MAEEKKIPFKELQDKAIEFFSTIPGVANVLPFYLLKTTNHNFAYHAQNSGDIIYCLGTGYYEVDSKGNKTDFYNKLNQPVMLFFWGSSIEGEKISDSKSILSLSPTICEILKIPAPNCSNEASLIRNDE